MKNLKDDILKLVKEDFPGSEVCGGAIFIKYALKGKKSPYEVAYIKYSEKSNDLIFNEKRNGFFGFLINYGAMEELSKKLDDLSNKISSKISNKVVHNKVYFRNKSWHII